MITGATQAAREWVKGAGLVTVLDDGGVVVGAVAAPGAGREWGAGVGGWNSTCP